MSSLATKSVSGSGKQRVAWIDFAKGICIFFVVMLHTTHYVEEYRNYQGGWIDYIVAFAKPFRMPDFFLIAGLFFANVVNRPWRSYLDSKVVHFYYFYVIWVTIIFVAFDIRESALEHNWANAESLPGAYFREFVNPKYPLWFIHSLPIYFVIVRLLKDVQWWIVWIFAALLQSIHVHTGFTVLDQFASRFVYFYTGCVFAMHVFRFSEWANNFPKKAAAYLLVWAILNQVLVHYKLDSLPGISLALGYLGALAVIFSSCLVSNIKWMDGLRFLGENSIVVYLGFMIPMAVFERYFRYKISDIGSAALLVTFLSVGSSAVMYIVASRTPLKFLYRRPAWARLEVKKRDVSLA